MAETTNKRKRHEIEVAVSAAAGGSTTMRAVVCDGGGVENLSLAEERRVPALGEREVLVRNMASGLNRIDV